MIIDDKKKTIVITVAYIIGLLYYVCYKKIIMWLGILYKLLADQYIPLYEVHDYRNISIRSGV